MSDDDIAGAMAEYERIIRQRLQRSILARIDVGPGGLDMLAAKYGTHAPASPSWSLYGVPLRVDDNLSIGEWRAVDELDREVGHGWLLGFRPDVPGQEDR